MNFDSGDSPFTKKVIWYLFTFMECNSEPDTLEALGLQPLRVGILVDSLQYTHKVSSDFFYYTLQVVSHPLLAVQNYSM
jgi:hypothetical protein